jgi:hypothetical protein
MVEKKRSKPHDPAAARPEIQLGGHVDGQGKPWVYMAVNGNPIPLSVPTAIEIGKSLIEHASERASDALLYEFLTSMEIGNDETLTMEDARGRAYDKLLAYQEYKVQRAMMAEQMNKAIAYGTHVPATPEGEGEVPA